MPTLTVQAKWLAAESQLASARPGADTDEYIDSTVAAVFDSPAPEAATVCRIALRVASGALTRRSAAIALALVATDDDDQAVDALVAAYRKAAGESFLASALLEAMGLLASRSSLARSELSSLLHRLKLTDDRFVLIKTSVIAGRLLCSGISPELKNRLNDFAAAEDASVCSEARYQLAIVALSEVFLAPDRATLLDRLRESRAAFARAEASEEARPDASALRNLLGLFILYGDQSHGPLNPSELAEGATAARAAWSSLSAAYWPGYGSETLELSAVRACAAADCLVRIAATVAVADEWRNFDEALVNLACLYNIIAHFQPTLSPSSPEAAIGKLAESIVAPRLGPVLAQAVGRQRLLAVRDSYIREHGRDSVTEGLYALIAAAEKCQQAEVSLSPTSAVRLVSIAELLGQTADELVRDFSAALTTGNLDEWGRALNVPGNALPIDRPGLYGGDPAVDEVVRLLLHDLRGRLVDYPPAWWTRLASVVESLVQFTHFTRDELPNYALCGEDGGCGQTASEADLKDDLFRWLRQTFGAAAVYERERLAGGRSDSGVSFPEAEFPIEVKHEFQQIGRDHIRRHYLSQPSDYAAVRQRVSLLLVLDLRASNSAGHQKRISAARTGGAMVPENTALYSLRDSFWLDALPLDPQILGGRPSVVLIGLLPGNRARPSSKTRYSRRPTLVADRK